MLVSTVDSRPLSIGLSKAGSWLNWSKSAAAPVWETTFVVASHLLAMVPDPTFKTMQSLTVSNDLVNAADAVIVFAASQPISQVNVPASLYLGPWPGGLVVVRV